MPRPSITPADTIKKRRQPIKRQRLGPVTVTVQHDGPGFMLCTHHADGKRSRQRFTTLSEATAAFSLRVAGIARDGAAASTGASGADLHAVTSFYAQTADWTPRPSVSDALQHFIEHQRALRTGGTVASAVADRLADADRRDQPMQVALQVQGAQPGGKGELHLRGSRTRPCASWPAGTGRRHPCQSRWLVGPVAGKAARGVVTPLWPAGPRGGNAGRGRRGNRR